MQIENWHRNGATILVDRYSSQGEKQKREEVKSWRKVTLC